MDKTISFAASPLDDASTSVIRRKALWACSIGNFFELYDFVVFGFFAAAIGHNFFPTKDPLISLLSGFATYGIGFAMRPVGAAIIGAYGDRRGRRSALILTVGMMSTATALTGLIPSYETLGIWAPILLVLCRSVQGISTGGEWGGAASFLVEFAPKGRRGYFGSWQQCSVGLGMLAASATAALLNQIFDHDTLFAWGWRLPFIFGFLLAPIGFYLRSRVGESPAFVRLEATKTVSATPLRTTFKTQRGAMLICFGSVASALVANYVFLVFIPAYSIQQMGINASQGLIATSIAYLMYAVLAPVSGALSDKYGRRKIALISAVGLLIFSYPAMWFLVTQKTIFALFLLECVFGLLLAMFIGLAPAMLCELFPSNVRYTALSTSYGLAVMIFAGFTPMASAALIKSTGSAMAPAYIAIGSALISIVALLFMRDRTRDDLE